VSTVACGVPGCRTLHPAARPATQPQPDSPLVEHPPSHLTRGPSPHTGGVRCEHHPGLFPCASTGQSLCFSFEARRGNFSLIDRSEEPRQVTFPTSVPRNSRSSTHDNVLYRARFSCAESPADRTSAHMSSARSGGLLARTQLKGTIQALRDGRRQTEAAFRP
jgi:hypothetical protein